MLVYLSWCQQHLNYSKNCVKRPLSKRPKIGFQDQLLLNAGQKFCRMLLLEHSAILLTFINLPIVIKIFVCLFLSDCFTVDVVGAHQLDLTPDTYCTNVHSSDIDFYNDSSFKDDPDVLSREEDCGGSIKLSCEAEGSGLLDCEGLIISSCEAEGPGL